MKKIRTQFLAAVMLCGVTALLAFNGVVAPPDFRGKWVLDVSKSSFGNVPVNNSPKSFMRIVQQDPMIVIEKSKTDSLGKTIVRMDTVFFDGKIRKITTRTGSVINRSSVREWSADGQVMKIVSKFSVDLNGQAQEFSGTERWSVGDGGQLLTIVTESVLPDRTEKATLVYNKAK